MQTVLARLGHIRAVPAVLAFYAVLLAGGLLPNQTGYEAGYSLACVLAFALYCGARPHHRWDVFLCAFVPSGFAVGVLEALVGIAPSWPLVLLGVLAVMFAIDREAAVDGRADDSLLTPARPYRSVSSGAPPKPSSLPSGSR